MKPTHVTSNGAANTGALSRRAVADANAEREIDRHVYALYPPSLDEPRRTRALTPDEIKIVEKPRGEDLSHVRHS